MDTTTNAEPADHRFADQGHPPAWLDRMATTKGQLLLLNMLRDK